MSSPKSVKKSALQKPRANVYTMMLIVSLCAIITGCVLLYLELQTYGEFPWWKVPPEVKAAV